MKKRIKVNTYPGVYYRLKKSKTRSGQLEKIYYVVYKKDGKTIEEKVGGQFTDAMTPARAARYRALRIEGKTKSRKEIREELKAQEARWTIDKLAAAYFDLKPKTKSILVDLGRYKNYLKPVFGDKTPDEITALEVARLRKNLEKKLSPQTTKHILGLLKRFVNFGAGKGLCEQLPFKVRMPRLNNEKTEDLTPEQLHRLLEAIEQDEHPFAGKVMLLALYTGMRRSEILRLRWDDIDFEKGFITIRNPKSGTDQIIPLNKSARDVVLSLPRYSQWLFPSPSGDKPLQNIYPALQRIRRRAGLPDDFRPLHGLRHVFASTLASTGQVDLYTLQRLLTHKTPRMTARYSHLRDEALKRASKVVDSVFSNEKPDKIVHLEAKKPQ